MISRPEYRAYFLHQAKTHPELLHSDQNLVFAEIAIEEAAFGDLREENVSQSGFIFRLFIPSARIGAGPSFPQQTIDGGFMVARKYDPMNVGAHDYSDAIDGSERIAYDILRKMYADSENGHPLFSGRAHSSLTATIRERPVEGDGSYGGVIVLWNLPQEFCYTSPAAETAWTDGGLTPLS